MQPDEYRKMAEVEDRMWYYDALHRHVARSLRGQSSSVRVLDAGCGTGGLLRKLGRIYPGWNLTGLDFSPLACELAKERTGGRVELGSILALPFPDEAFDIIVSCDVLCQVRAPELAIKEFNRCLKPGGVVIVTMPAYQWMYSYHDRHVANLRRYSRSEVNRLLQAEALTITSSTYWNMLPFPLAVFRRKIMAPGSPSSDVKLYPAPIEGIFNGLMALERCWLSGGGRLPFGSSVLTVARKPSHDVTSRIP